MASVFEEMKLEKWKKNNNSSRLIAIQFTGSRYEYSNSLNWRGHMICTLLAQCDCEITVVKQIDS